MNYNHAIEIKAKKTLALEQFVKTLIVKGVCEIKELVDYETQKMNPQLVTDILTFVESQVQQSKFKGKIDKKQLVLDILATCYELSEAEKSVIDTMIQHNIDNNLVKTGFSTVRFLVAVGSCLLNALSK